LKTIKENLRVDEVAIRLNVSKRTVYRLIEDGGLIGFLARGSLRVPFTEVERFIKRQISIYQDKHEIYCDSCDNE